MTLFFFYLCHFLFEVPVVAVQENDICVLELTVHCIFCFTFIGS
jgi:hypothetical protein